MQTLAFSASATVPKPHRATSIAVQEQLTLNLFWQQGHGACFTRGKTSRHIKRCAQKVCIQFYTFKGNHLLIIYSLIYRFQYTVLENADLSESMSHGAWMA